MDEHSNANLERFFRELQPVEAVYGDPEFTYLVRYGESGAVLVGSRLILQPLPHDRPDRVIEAANFYGFSGRLTSLGVQPRQLIEMLLNGYVPAPDRTWCLLKDEDLPGPRLLRQHQLGQNSVDHQQRISELVGMCLSSDYRKSEDDDWALRAAKTPFSNMNDLLSDLGLPVNFPYQLHILAFPPVVIDVQSRVRGELAELKIRRLRHLPVEKVAMGVVVSSATGVTQRTSISGEEFAWEQSDVSKDLLVGRFEMCVAKASVVHCLAVYDNECLHHYWVNDPDASQNPLRTIYELFDPAFEYAVEMLSQSAKKGKSEGHEDAVAALLWVLGFAPLHIGRNSEAPDVIAVSRDGHILVVECTLSDLQVKKQNKPQKLLDRTKDIKAALERSNAGDSICIPVMVTARRREDILHDIQECERRGIVVYTHDDITPLVLSTINAPRSEQHFAEARQRLSSAIDRVMREEQQMQEIARAAKDIGQSR